MSEPVTPKRTTVTFASGLPGFESCQRFILMQSKDFDPGVCLKGLDAPEPAFFLMDPRKLAPGFECELSAADRARLRADANGKNDSLVWLVIVSWVGDEPRINWRAPIVINPATMLGIQLVPGESDIEEPARDAAMSQEPACLS